jgi:hypothetical protein
MAEELLAMLDDSVDSTATMDEDEVAYLKPAHIMMLTPPLSPATEVFSASSMVRHLEFDPVSEVDLIHKPSPLFEFEHR